MEIWTKTTKVRKLKTRHHVTIFGAFFLIFFYAPTITVDFIKFQQLIIANPGVVPPDHEYMTVECLGMTECTKNRCEYETYWGLEMSKILTDNIIAGFSPNGVNPANENLDEDLCVKKTGASGVAADSCCGESPLWQLYSSGTQSCVNGILM